MKPISLQEIWSFGKTASESFNGKCKVLTPTVSTDSLGDIINTWTTGIEVACGLQFIGGKEVKGEMTVLPFDAKLRLPFNTVVESNCKILMTEYLLSPYAETFEIVSEPRYGVSCITLDLKKVSL
jgi:hypothetical protein